jgi:hypothetical protein
MRIGEVLIQLGLITTEQLEAGRRAQAQAGARLGTQLVELGFIGTDQLSRALGQLLGVPAALEEHFAHADPAVVAKLRPALAVRFQSVPLGFSRTGRRRIVVAMANPLDMTLVDDLAFAMGAQVEPLVASELAIARNIKRLYGVELNLKLGVPVAFSPSGNASARASNTPIPVDGRAYTPPVGSPVEAQGKPPVSRPASHPTPVPVNVQARPTGHPTPMPVKALTRTESYPIPPTPGPKAKPAPVISLEEAAHRLTVAADRDALAEVIRDFMAGYFGCGMVFGVRDGQARVWRGFAQDVPSAAVETVAFPITMPSCFRTAYDSGAAFRGAPPAEGQKLQRQIWKYLHSAEPSEVLVVPILVKNRVLNLVYAHAADFGRLPDGPVSDLVALCAAASSVYVRMIQRMKEEAQPGAPTVAR